MSTLTIDPTSIPPLEGKTAVVTATPLVPGGASGIGLAAAKIMLQKGATVYALDRQEPIEAVPGLKFRRCDVTSWSALREVFDEIQQVHLAFANAGICDKSPESYYDDVCDNGNLQEPDYSMIDVNLKAVLNFVKLARHSMRRHQVQGSIVITASSTGLVPEQSAPVYSSTKFAVIGLVRTLRSVLIQENITINAVAPFVTTTGMAPAEAMVPLKNLGVQTSPADFVGLALVYSAVARQTRRVEAYGKETEEDILEHGRWNGRVILTLGDKYTEVEEEFSKSRPLWTGGEVLQSIRLQQAVLDFRHGGVAIKSNRPSNQLN
ncbi:Atr7 [Stachybotrys chlorohalonatus IBT 40285]|uniref:Short-chain dehydrogenase/reductase ATR7 n=1 Tax=Stachybotrys chlorohalonatus (strain IBT 40285) TaxID=1283841 RepID=ATR7_STAC4|nr:RecName: Full=Short-chain dehydrogenase/reductase ATR7; AltName: Full=Core atranone cluster (CAC) protein 7 [Stachybotrys chlorohalonata IBT 40285]KFA70086.1 Atr7 [Stachybotrys chlorohalonata IBT 40285]